MQKGQEIRQVCHTLKSHISARSMAVYLLRKKLPGSNEPEISEILSVLENSMQKEMILIEQLEKLTLPEDLPAKTENPEPAV